MITISALATAPGFAQGLVRDLRVRWALEEAGLPYRTRLIDRATLASAEYRALQPFGQVPVFQDGDLKLFESGAIVLHIAADSAALMPDDAVGRAKAAQWVFAAISSIEPQVQQVASIDLHYPGQNWAVQRRPSAEAMLVKRLGDLSVALGDREWLEDRFTAGDLMMVSVLRILRHTDLVERFANLHAYRTRAEARPAFQRALAEQMAPFLEHKQQQARQ